MRSRAVAGRGRARPPGRGLIEAAATVIRGRAPVALLIALLVAACAGPAPDPEPVRVGAIYPLSGSQAEGGRQELGGVRAALHLAEREATLGNRRVKLTVVPVETPAAARAAVDRLVDRERVSVIVGTYGSALAEAAAARADERRTVYWETGAVADLITHGHSHVFRTVAAGSTLGRTAVRFTAETLLAGADRGRARVVIVNVADLYGRSVAEGELDLARELGIPVVDRIEYEPRSFDPAQVAARIGAARPDYLWDISYIEDGIALWQQVRAAGIPLRAVVGTSSAFCMEEFGRRLGTAAIGVYAADKPDDEVTAAALTPAAQALLVRAKSVYAAENSGSEMPIPAVAGFVGGWTLFHGVLPRIRGNVTAEAVRGAAHDLDEPAGTSINGGGVRFAPAGSPEAGQNLRAPSVVGQWQQVGVMRTVYPPAFATAPVLSGSR